MMGARNGHIVPILPANDASLATGVIRHTGLDHLGDRSLRDSEALSDANRGHFAAVNQSVHSHLRDAHDVRHFRDGHKARRRLLFH